MPRGPLLSRDQRAALLSGIAADIGASESFREMERQGLFKDPHPPLDLRTIQRHYKMLKGEVDPSGPWALHEERQPECAALILELAWALSRWTQGRATVSRQLAETIKRVRLAAPEMRLERVYSISWGYMTAASRQITDLRLLDLVLAYEVAKERGSESETISLTMQDLRANLAEGKVADIHLFSLLDIPEYGSETIALVQDTFVVFGWAVSQQRQLERQGAADQPDNLEARLADIVRERNDVDVVRGRVVRKAT